MGQEVIKGAKKIKNKRTQLCPANASMLTFSLDTLIVTHELRNGLCFRDRNQRL